MEVASGERGEAPSGGGDFRRPEASASPIYRKGGTFMAHLNPLEKEFLIRQFKLNGRIKLSDFCTLNKVSDAAFRKWLRQYEEGGLEGLARADAEIREVLPEGIDRTEEAYKREILRLRIENERLKKKLCRSDERSWGTGVCSFNPNRSLEI